MHNLLALAALALLPPTALATPGTTFCTAPGLGGACSFRPVTLVTNPRVALQGTPWHRAIASMAMDPGVYCQLFAGDDQDGPASPLIGPPGVADLAEIGWSARAGSMRCSGPASVKQRD